MVDLGLTWVRMGEFSWSRVEPSPGKLSFDWLDRAMDVLGDAGLQVVLSTPTATPPRWMLDRHPDMLAVDALGHVRGFGSRRHYCFSHGGYRAEAARIATLFAERYARHPALAAWQTDNEYGCHDTTLSYSKAARAAFRDWLAQRYQSVDALNRAWGNVFWSMDYQSIDQIELPNLTVTEPNPAHVMDFRRFSSDQVARFNQTQVAAIRRHSTAPISHNFMGGVTEFDHFVLGQQMEIAAWDSYPLGFLQDRVGASETQKISYARQGDPDFQAFHHDLYRAVGQGRWWVMEQQPGPVNWAPVNTIPLPGMVRLWTWEAFAHGAEAVCYFRWRQAPFGQEQMHTGLLRPDHAPAPGWAEAEAVASELRDWPEVEQSQAPVALIFDYQAAWSWDVQPQGEACSYLRLILDIYRALRRLGLSIDILAPDADLSGYQLVMAPGLEMPPDDLVERAYAHGVVLCLGPRFGSKTWEFAIPVPLPPNVPGLDIQVTRVETLAEGDKVAARGGGAVQYWREEVETTRAPVFVDRLGNPILAAKDRLHYLTSWPDAMLANRVLHHLCDIANIETTILPEGLRLREAGGQRFLFNYGSKEVKFGGHTIPVAGVVLGFSG